ncbi:hypothetical protein EVAR_98101_1 [Eumeta japonica]|uniref:Uncharacterized protein n=1 Tax=Eumeta variegata TaxID=151549 RepID=A0A4C1XIV5_EUMVA|nr:hypothetical protein EVAR_98101_1 [Eumeta japonica]
MFGYYCAGDRPMAWGGGLIDVNAGAVRRYGYTCHVAGADFDGLVNPCRIRVIFFFCASHQTLASIGHCFHTTTRPRIRRSKQGTFWLEHRPPAHAPHKRFSQRSPNRIPGVRVYEIIQCNADYVTEAYSVFGARRTRSARPGCSWSCDAEAQDRDV